MGDSYSFCHLCSGFVFFVLREYLIEIVGVSIWRVPVILSKFGKRHPHFLT